MKTLSTDRLHEVCTPFLDLSDREQQELVILTRENRQSQWPIQKGYYLPSCKAPKKETE